MVFSSSTVKIHYWIGICGTKIENIRDIKTQMNKDTNRTIKQNCRLEYIWCIWCFVLLYCKFLKHSKPSSVFGTFLLDEYFLWKGTLSSHVYIEILLIFSKSILTPKSFTQNAFQTNHCCVYLPRCCDSARFGYDKFPVVPSTKVTFIIQLTSCCIIISHWFILSLLVLVHSYLPSGQTDVKTNKHTVCIL